jgi:penicillin-binding protein 2
LQLAQGIAAIASGQRQPLHVLRATQDGLDAKRVPQRPQLPDGMTAYFGSAANLAAVREGLVAVMHGPTGTARASAAGSEYLIAGKTGTAQRIGRTGSRSLNPANLPMHLRHRALFVGFAPADAPRIAIAVVAEHGGAGSRVAAPIARKVMDAWLLGKAVEAVPPSPEPGAVETPPETATPASPTAIPTTAPSAAAPATSTAAPTVTPAPVPAAAQ